MRHNMRVLDIDLDFFLTDTCPFAEEGSRPDDSCASPYDEQVVRCFLENNMLLSREMPLPGRIFETHDGAAFFWKDMVDAGRLTVPFSVTHVDAHTDLGIAQKNYPYIKYNVLGRPVENRADFEGFRQLGQINEANYLAFVVAARWIDRLENLRNPKSKPDFPEPMRDGDGIRLESAFPALFEARFGREPLVKYIEYTDGLGYKAHEPFDFVSLALSPRYSPACADGLARIIGEYIYAQ